MIMKPAVNSKNYDTDQKTKGVVAQLTMALSYEASEVHQDNV
jgi:hypothetical protein